MAGRGRGRARGQRTTLTRAAAVVLKRNLQQEVAVLQTQLSLVDEICRSTRPRATQITLITPQIGAINAQIANITNILGDINAHSLAQPGIITQQMVDEWNDFEPEATTLSNIVFAANTFNQWKVQRAAFNTLFEVDLSVTPPGQAVLNSVLGGNPPPINPSSHVALSGQGSMNIPNPNPAGGLGSANTSGPSSSGQAQNQNIGQLPAGSDPNSTIARVVPEPGFTCEEPLLSQLLTAGALPRNIALGNKTATVYIYENLVQPYAKFDGVTTTHSLVTMFARFDEVHKAPASQITYQKKVEAVFQCLDGLAKQSVIGFEGARTRLHYLQLWHLLFKLYGNRAQSISTQVRAIGEASMRSSDPLDRLQYMHQLNSGAQQLIMLGHPNDQIASLVWSSLRIYMPTWISKYCRKQVPNFDEEFGSDVATWLCVNGLPKFHQFYSFMISRTTTDTSVRPVGSVIHANVLAAQADIKGSSGSNKEDTGEPPAKKSKRNNGASAPGGGSGNSNSDDSDSRRKSAKKESECYICHGDHPAKSCPKTIDERIEICEKEKRCKACWSKNHTLDECKSKKRCSRCADPKKPNKGRHNAAICYKTHGYPKNHKQANSSEEGKGRKQKKSNSSQENSSKSGKSNDQRSSNSNDKSDKPDPAVMALFQSMLMSMPQGRAYVAQRDAEQNGGPSTSGSTASGSGTHRDGQSDTASSNNTS
jgi:hypothetical protein